MSKVIAYLRVSTDKQDMEVQRKEIRDYADRNGIEINQWIEAEISSRKSVRDRGIDELVGILKRGDTLIVSELSRLARSIRQSHDITEDLIRNKVIIHFIRQGFVARENDMTTKITINAWAMSAEIERELISSRTKQGLALAKARGKKLGNPNLDSDNERRIREANKFAEGLRDVITGLIRQGLSQRKIVGNLNSAGIRTARGKEWQLMTLQRTMKRLNINTERGKK